LPPVIVYFAYSESSRSGGGRSHFGSATSLDGLASELDCSVGWRDPLGAPEVQVADDQLFMGP
jgi:hypothetical protein